MNKITLQEINKCMELLSMDINDLNSAIENLPDCSEADRVCQEFNALIKRFNELEKIIDEDLNNGKI